MKSIGVLTAFLLAVSQTMPLTDAAESQAVRTPAATSELRFYTLPGCTYCKQAKDFMAMNKIDYREYDMTTPAGAKAAETLDVPLMAPMFAYKNRILRGFTPGKLERFLQD